MSHRYRPRVNWARRWVGLTVCLLLVGAFCVGLARNDGIGVRFKRNTPTFGVGICDTALMIYWGTWPGAGSIPLQWSVVHGRTPARGGWVHDQWLGWPPGTSSVAS